MGEIKYNGRTYSGLIQANGCFVDTTNLLLATTSFRTSYSYTATEDCFVCLYVVPKENDDVHVDIDGEKVAAWWRGSAVSDETARYLRKGQTISVVNAHASYDSFIWVYGLMQGSPITFLSEYASACYDTNEREVGCWIDGKPIYQKTVVLSNVSYDSNWHDVAHGIANIDNIVDAKAVCMTTNGYWYTIPVPRANTSWGVTLEFTPTNISYINNWLEYADTMYVTLQYTKTTDTAGSGKLTPTGFETHHYSTNEQIVGTWIDGKPLYERSFVKTLSGSPDVNGDSFLVASGISDIDTLVKIDGTVKENNNYAFFGYSGIADANSGWRYSFHLNPDSQLVVWTSNNSQCWIHVANGKAVCTIQYTKTTD